MAVATAEGALESDLSNQEPSELGRPDDARAALVAVTLRQDVVDHGQEVTLPAAHRLTGNPGQRVDGRRLQADVLCEIVPQPTERGMQLIDVLVSSRVADQPDRDHQVEVRHTSVHHHHHLQVASTLVTLVARTTVAISGGAPGTPIKPTAYTSSNGWTIPRGWDRAR
jgi:hypothetical protein